MIIRALDLQGVPVPMKAMRLHGIFSLEARSHEHLYVGPIEIESDEEYEREERQAYVPMGVCIMNCQPRKNYKEVPPCEKSISLKEYLLWFGFVVLLAILSRWWS
jgi:hypothetical protein